MNTDSRSEIQKTHAFWKPHAPDRLAGFTLSQGVDSVCIGPLGTLPKNHVAVFMASNHILMRSVQDIQWWMKEISNRNAQYILEMFCCFLVLDI